MANGPLAVVRLTLAMDGPCVRRVRTTSAAPAHAARCNGLEPRSSALLQEASYVRRSSTMCLEERKLAAGIGTCPRKREGEWRVLERSNYERRGKRMEESSCPSRRTERKRRKGVLQRQLRRREKKRKRKKNELLSV